ncbi:MAG: glucose-1-phosphate adenylyltransferase [Acidobacteriota bacterium]
MKEVLGVILGGGKGTRLFPLTSMRSKPAVPIGGKYRVIDVPISNCINSGIHKIFVLTQFNSASLNRHISQTYKFSLFSQGFVDILAAEQTLESPHWFQGTADAVRQSLVHLQGYAVDHVLILSGDQLYRMNFRELYAQHLECGADVTVAAHPVGVRQAHSFGVLKMANDFQITRFVEKPQDAEMVASLRTDEATLKHFGARQTGKNLLASMGIYLFKRDFLFELLKDEQMIDFGKDILPSLVGRRKVSGYVFSDYWEDIGTIESFFQANLDLTKDDPPFTFYDAEAPIYTHPRFLPASHVNNCTIATSIVAEGCRLDGARLEQCVIGIRSTIASGCKLERVLMLGADYYEERVPRGKPRLGVGAGSKISNAILDKNCRIGEGAVIENRAGVRETDGSGYYIRDGIVIVPKDGIIAPGTVI